MSCRGQAGNRRHAAKHGPLSGCEYAASLSQRQAASGDNLYFYRKNPKKPAQTGFYWNCWCAWPYQLTRIILIFNLLSILSVIDKISHFMPRNA